MKLGPSTLRGRLALQVFLLVAGLAVVALLTIGRLLSRELTREMARSAEAQLRYIEGVMRHHDRGEPAFIRDEMVEFEGRTGSLVEILDGSRPVFASPGLAGRSLPEASGQIRFERSVYQVAASRSGAVQLRVAVPATSMERLRRTSDLTIATLAGVGFLLAALVAHRLAASVVAPVSAVASAAERVRFDELSQRLDVPKASSDEVSRLVTSFNAMLDRLEDASGRLQRFTADAAHELRTPLTAMKAQLQADAAGSTAAFRPDLRAVLLGEVDRLSGLVERLLVLAEVDAAPLSRTPVDFSDVVVERVEAARAAAERRAVRLDLATLDPVQVPGDAVLLRRVVDNLVENAIKFTPAQGHVQVSLHRIGEQAVLHVEDSGIGIAPAAMPHVFERFFREDPSRTRASGGAGLGLAIVAAVVQAHGGRIDATSEPGHGSRFRVHLPIVSSFAATGR